MNNFDQANQDSNIPTGIVGDGQAQINNDQPKIGAWKGGWLLAKAS